MPEQTPENADALQQLEERFRQGNITMVTNFIDGIPKPWAGPRVNFFPNVLSFYNDTTDNNVTA